MCNMSIGVRLIRRCVAMIPGSRTVDLPMSKHMQAASCQERQREQEPERKSRKAFEREIAICGAPSHVGQPPQIHQQRTGAALECVLYAELVLCLRGDVLQAAIELTVGTCSGRWCRLVKSAQIVSN